MDCALKVYFSQECVILITLNKKSYHATRQAFFD